MMNQLIEIDTLEKYQEAILGHSILVFSTTWCPDCHFLKTFIDDLVAICMWFSPLINGQIGLFSVFICQILLLISDIYGVYNWEIIKQRQKGKKQ